MSSPINPNNTFSQDVRALAKDSDKKEGETVGSKVSDLAHEKKAEAVQESVSVTAKKQLNAAIIESSLKFSQSIGDKPLSLVLKTALQGINEALQQSAGVDASATSIEDAYESGVDYSPEATADRIVSFSTQLYGAYREQNPELSEEESVSNFVDIIRGGIDQGFDEAKDILESLSVLEGDISADIDKTYEFVQSGLQSFVDSFNKEEEQPTE